MRVGKRAKNIGWKEFFCLLLEICFLPRCWRWWQFSNISPFLPTPLFWQTDDLPNIRVRSVSAIFCAPHFLALSVWWDGFSTGKITMFFSNRLDFLCIELSTLLMPCFAIIIRGGDGLWMRIFWFAIIYTDIRIIVQSIGLMMQGRGIISNFKGRILTWYCSSARDFLFAGCFAIIELLFACATSFAAFFAQVRCDADVLREIMKECRNWWSKEKKKTKTPFARICYFVFICAIVSKIFHCFWWKLVLYYYQ